MENKISNILLMVWSVLAIASFVVAFFVTPLIATIILLVFGGLNLMIIGSWAIAFIQAIKEYNKAKKKE